MRALQTELKFRGMSGKALASSPPSFFPSTLSSHPGPHFSNRPRPWHLFSFLGTLLLPSTQVSTPHSGLHPHPPQRPWGHHTARVPLRAIALPPSASHMSAPAMALLTCAQYASSHGNVSFLRRWDSISPIHCCLLRWRHIINAQ